MNGKQAGRLRRARRVSARLKSSGVHRLCVHRSSKHMYAQIIKDNPDGSCEALLGVSTLSSDVKGTGIERAVRLGQKVAEQAKAKGITKVGFDRRGYRYHGCVKALADAAREGGLEF